MYVECMYIDIYLNNVNFCVEFKGFDIENFIYSICFTFIIYLIGEKRIDLYICILGYGI